MKTATAPLPPLRSVKVLDQLRERIRYLHYSLPTEQAYVHWVRAFIRFHGVRHPATLGSSEVEAFLSWLANERKAHEYQKLLLKHQLLPSMSGKGNCFDNSAVESFFKSLKAELIWRRHWQTRRDIEIAIFEYINGFYNPRRRHSTLGWKSPVAFEKKAA